METRRLFLMELSLGNVRFAESNYLVRDRKEPRVDYRKVEAEPSSLVQIIADYL